MTPSTFGLTANVSLGPVGARKKSSTSALVRPAGHVSRCAVSLSWLLRFVQQHRVRERGLTAGELVDRFVRPPTAAKQCRFAELLLADPDPRQRAAVSQGRPFFFVSHTWVRPFGETLDMLEHHFQPEQQRLWRRRPDGQPLPALAADEVFLWVDIFAINQHAADDLAVLWEAVYDAEETLMVLDRHGLVFSRIWCLYEAWQTSRAGPSKLRLLSYGAEIDSLEKIFINLDVRNAKASVEADRVRILEDIRRDPTAGGIKGMTHRLKEALVRGAVAQVPPAEEDDDEAALRAAAAGTAGRSDGATAAAAAADLVTRLYTAAVLCHMYGQLPEAESLYRRALRQLEASAGPAHTDTLTCVSNLAILLQVQGAYDEAKALHRRALAGRGRVLGTDHPNTLSCVNNLANLLYDQGLYDEAEPLHRRALYGRERVLGASHPDTLASLNNLANALHSLGRYDEAQKLQRRALYGREVVLGPDHPDTLASVNNLANALYDQGMYSDAMPLHRRALESRERVLGDEHPETLGSVDNLANVLQSLGRYKEAEPLQRRALAGRERVLGPDHPDTLASLGNLAVLLQSLAAGGDEAAFPSSAAAATSGGYLAEAESLHRRALVGRERVLGPDHPHTLASVSGLAELMQSSGRHDHARALHRRAMEGMARVLGSEHPHTLAAASGLAGALFCLGRYEEAELLYRRALAGMERVLGAGHPDTLAVEEGLERVRRCKGPGQQRQRLRGATTSAGQVMIGAVPGAASGAGAKK
ncbi:hypothetical protein Vretimale_16879, partial [Volvox reticuliferus]